MDPPESHDSDTTASRARPDSPSRRINDAHDLHVTLSPALNFPHDVSLPPLSTSAVDALRSVYFPGDGRPRSQSNPDYLHADISHGSRLADVSEPDTMENLSDLNRSRTQPPVKTRRRRKADREGSTRVMSTGEEEVPLGWTVFGELFEDHRAPLGKQAPEREQRSAAATNTGTEEQGVARTASSVIHHWRSIMSNSRPSRVVPDEERGALNGEGSSSRQGDILSRTKTSRIPPSGVENPRSPGTVQSPSTEEPVAPLIRVIDGDEDVLDHHRLTADYERSSRPPSRRSKSTRSVSSASSDSSSDSGDSELTSLPPVRNKLSAKLREWKDEIPPLSTLQRNMLKCAIAYFLASLFTFVPFLSSFISDIGSFGKGGTEPSPSAHMIATVYVIYSKLVSRTALIAK